VCDTDVSRDIGRCTNGCCSQCHERFCTSPEHTIDVAPTKALWAKFYNTGKHDYNS